MKIRFLTSISCEIHGSHAPGDVVDWPDAEAERLVERGYAEPAEVRETASKRGGRERAVKDTPTEKE